MAVVMVFGVITPFNIGRVKVSASAPMPFTDTLLAWLPGQDNSLQLRGGFGEPVAFSPPMRPGGPSANDITLAWPILTSAGETGMHVLRYFTQTGAKVELWVTHDPDVATLTVEYFVFPRSMTPVAGYFAGRERIYNHGRPVDPRYSTNLINIPNMAGPGGYFTCPYDAGVLLRFMWGRNVANENDLFFFDIQGGIAPGFVYDFTLEHYNNDNAIRYREQLEQVSPSMHHVAWMSNTDPIRIAEGLPLYTTVGGRGRRSDRIFVFSGFSMGDISVIPFAYARIPGTADEYAPHTPFQDWNAHTTESLRGDAGVHFPAYLHHALNLKDNPPVETPAMNSPALTTPEGVGMDIRVRLPRFFDEAAGSFNVDYYYGTQRHNIPNMQLRVEVGPSSEESFEIIVPNVTNLQAWNQTNDRASGNTTGVAQFNYYLSRDNPIILRDASLLRDMSETADFGGTGVEGTSIARFSVGGLLPSLVYDLLDVSLMYLGSPAVARQFVRMRTGFRFPEQNIRLHTLLYYFFTPRIGGSVHAIIQPFRRHDFTRRAGGPGWAGAVEGDYLFQWGEANIGFPPIRVHYTGGTNEIRIPVQRNLESNYTVQFEFGTHTIISQTVVIVPDDRASVGMPNSFEVNRISYRPTRLPPDEPEGTLAELVFGLSWELGQMADIRAMIEEADDNEITIVYYLYRGTTPNRENIATERIARVYVRLGQETLGPIHPVLAQYRVEFIQPTSDPLNPVETVPGLTFETPGFGLDWDDPDIEYDILRGMTAIARIDPDPRYNFGIAVPASQVVDGPDWIGGWNEPFRFPRVYHMFLQPALLHRGIPSVTTAVENLLLYGWPASRTRALTLDDFGQAVPPPPIAFNITSQPAADAPPSLNVSFDVPIAGINAYTAQQYPFAPFVQFNAYIGTDEDAINEYKENGGTVTLHDIDFMQRIFEHNENITTEPTMTVALTTEELNRLRSGEILRISGIPLMRPFTPNAVINAHTQRLADPVAYLSDALDTNQAALDNTARLTIDFDIIGLDENLRHFMFADMTVERYIAEETTLFAGEEVGGPILTLTDGGMVVRQSRSVFTELSGSVTIGTPQEPDPIEVDPSAPGNISHEGLGQSYVTVFWDTDNSSDPTVATEYEIVRVSDNRLNINAMTDADGNPMTLAQIVAARTDAMAWRTNHHFDFVEQATAPFMQVYRSPLPEVRPLSDAREPYQYFPSYIPETERSGEQAAFTDRSLRPNNLYFYYVRTLRRVKFNEYDAEGNVLHTHILENRSSWVEESVTTPVVQPPVDLRVEDGESRSGFDPLSQQFVSWNHPAAVNIIESLRTAPNAGLIFQYQLRVDGETWSDLRTVSVSHMLNAENFDAATGRFYYMVRGLEAGTAYQMRVRVIDRDTQDTSLWSNVITFLTAWDDSRHQLDRETDRWLEQLRRLLLEQLRRPYWSAADTPDLLRLVYRPAAFRNLLDASADTVALHNTNARTTIYYLPVSGILEANEHRKGFSTGFDDTDVVFAPRFLNGDQNRAILEMARHVANRNMPVNDYFVRLTMVRHPIPGQLYGNPILGNATEVRIDLVGVNTNARNIQTWDTAMQTRAEAVIERRLTDPVLRQNILNQIERGEFLGERAAYVMLDYLARIEAEVAAELSMMVTRDIPLVSNMVGIIAPVVIPVTQLDTAIHVISTGNTPNISVNGFTQVQNRAGIREWLQTPLVQQGAGQAIITQTPGMFVFTGRAVNIPGIENVPGGDGITALVTRFGLTDVFGHGAVDMHRNATRHMVAGSIARMAGAPAGADGISWVAANMNFAMANRNANALVSQQEAIAMVMALYERRTNTRTDTVLIRNHQQTAGMLLDPRYAQGVRAAFEIGIVTGLDIQPAMPVTIGDLLQMLTALDAKVGL
jgi:hypothetical protein